jgi:hypothetical protein
VELEPENGGWRDSRELTRALIGNIEGAIENFQSFIALINNEEEKLQRQRWIDALRAGGKLTLLLAHKSHSFNISDNQCDRL